MSKPRQWLNVIFCFVLAAILLGGFIGFQDVRGLVYGLALLVAGAYLAVGVIRGKDHASVVSTNKKATVLTKNVSVWSHVSFYTGIASVFVVTIPVAFISGIVGIIQSQQRGYEGVWRAWVGIVVSIVMTFLYIPLLRSIFNR